MDPWQRWVADHLGSDSVLVDASNPDGEAQVWRVTQGGRTTAFVKVHRGPDKWRRERAMLARLHAWHPPLAQVTTPAVLASDAPRHALLLSALPGLPASDQALGLEHRRALHRHAGRFRRRLDAVQLDADDPVPLADAIAQRMHAACARARSTLDPSLLRRTEAALSPECFDGAQRRWCHRDFAPHNWIVSTQTDPTTLGVIDFGQARPDAWLVDVLKLWDGPWLAEPTLADAFWQGYGRRLEPLERTQLRQLAMLHGLTTAAWGDQHRHAPLSRHGRAVLLRVLQPLGPEATP